MFKYFFVYLKRYLRYLISACLLLVVVDVLDVAWPLIIRYAIDHLTSPDALKILLWCFIGYVGIVAFQGICRYFFRIFFLGTSHRIARDLRNEFFQHIQSLSVGYFNTTKTGDLMSLATNDIEAVREFYARGLFIGTDIMVYIITVPFIMLALSVKLTLLSVILIPLLPFFVHRMGNLIHKRFKEMQETYSEMSNCSQENFAGIRIVKSFAQEQTQICNFDKISLKYVSQNLSLAKLQAIFGSTMELSATVGMIIVLFVGGMEAINGKISIGTFVAFPFYLHKLTWPMAALGETVSTFQRSSASMKRIRELFNIKPDITSPANPVIKPINGEIEFRNASLVYPQTNTVALEDINLKIKQGTSVAIMGQIGSGKTSLVNLIPRIFEPTKGEVIIDGINVKDYSLSELRRQIGFVPQDVFLFSDSIKENIAFGIFHQESAVEQKIQQAAKTAMIHQEIEGFNDRYNTILGERGVNLSGGQKQRITIARAFIKDPKILVMDDCLASVDVDTEEVILKQLKELLRNRTTIIISHRLPVIKIVDLIVFMEKGRIAEMGTHAELLALNGSYARFYQKQELINDLEKI